MSDSIPENISNAAFDAGQFAVQHREPIVWGICGFVAGQILEEIPILGWIISPFICSLGSAAYGYRQMLDRRHLEHLEHLSGS